MGVRGRDHFWIRARMEERKCDPVPDGTVSAETVAFPASWGRYGFDGGIGPWEACRAPLARKSGGTTITADTQLALAA